MFCKFCGKEISEDSKFCPFCGKKLIEETVDNNQTETTYETNNSEKPNSNTNSGEKENTGVVALSTQSSNFNTNSAYDKKGSDSTWQTYQSEKSPKSRAGAAALAFFLGVFGAHRFYAGKTGSAITMLIISIVGFFTAIPFIATGIWSLVDFIMILCGSFKDKDNLPIENW